MVPKPRKALTLERKIDVISKLETGEKKSSVASSMNIARTTINGIWKAKEKYKREFQSMNPKLTKMRKPEFEDVDHALLRWFNIQRNRNIPIDGPILICKAEEFAILFKKDKFKGSQGWLTKWKQRHNIQLKNLHGESAEVDAGVVSDWVKNVYPVVTRGYSLSDIFNADETGLFYKALPDKTFEYKDKKCKGGKRSKERLTALFCCNSDGSEKLKPLIIGKYQNPRCFQKIKDRASLPVTYCANSKAWMTGEIFKNWLQKVDKEMGKKRRKILLLIDNCGAHPGNIKLNNVKVVFMPPNTTSVLQPLDQGIIANAKRFYRRLLVQKVIRLIDAEKPVKISVFDSILLLHSAWSKVQPSTISNCFKRAFAREEDEVEMVTGDSDSSAAGIPIMDIERLGISASQFVDYELVDNQLQTEWNPSEGEIAEQFLEEATRQQDPGTIAESDDDDEEVPPEPLSTSQILSLVSDIKVWIASQQSTDDQIWTSILSVERFAQQELSRSLKQSEITDFFRFV